jgi:hypothetical protein
MYLGILMFCLGFFLPVLQFSRVWPAFFIMYDKITTYDEEDWFADLARSTLTAKKEYRNGFLNLQSANREID